MLMNEFDFILLELSFKFEVKLGNNARNFLSPQSVVTFLLLFWALITAVQQEILRFFFVLPGIEKN